MALKYGFFDAIHKADGTYDRAYSSEDLNKYLSGLVNQNGVFKTVDGNMKVVPGASKFADYYSNYKNADGESKILVKVSAGKAIVNSHWVKIDSSYNIELDVPRATDRVDKVSLRWVEGDRRCYICVESSDKTTGEDGRGKGDIPYTMLQNYIINNVKYTVPEAIGQKKSGSTIIFSPDHGLCEIVLAYIHVPSSMSTTPEKEFYIRNEVGSARCPWISHMIQDPNNADLDKWLANYTELFDDWLHSLLEKNQLDQSVTFHDFHFPSGTTLPLILVKGSGTRASSFPGYKYDTRDHISVYYNGLLLNNLGSSPEWTIEPYGTTGWMLKLTHVATLTAGNTIDVSIVSGALTNIPDGDQLLY